MEAEAPPPGPHRRDGGPSVQQVRPTGGPVREPVAAREARPPGRRENRRRVLAVARESLAGSGSASPTEIARQAGLGVGTLYRHFPTRKALTVELYRHEIQRLTDRVPALLGEHPPLEACADGPPRSRTTAGSGPASPR
ncbi:TetR/AcrR family transcriptional regulator [Streptomyces sp. NPDC005017]|uniref:TetR/AcrR family transcriptional regulator n=1 Tax=Streptomyces sp. NPDC005017 TaxID=3364706 RepID=UPI0036A57EF0